MRVLTLLLALTTIALFSCKKEYNTYNYYTTRDTLINTDTVIKKDTIVLKDTLPASLKNGLVAWFPFTGNAKDSSSYNNHALISGPVLTTDRLGNANRAYYFNGISDFMWIPYNTPMHLLGDFSIAMWLKPDETTPTYGTNTMVYLYGDSSIAGHDPMFMQYNVVRHNASIGSDRGDGTIANELTMPTDVRFRNIWVHVTGTWEQATRTHKIYANGRLLATQVFSVSNLDYSSTPTQNFVTYLGVTDRKYVFYKGSMDDVRVYNRPLTDSEVAALAK